MRFLVVGGAGNVGEVVISYLARQPDVECVICGDVNMDRAKMLVKKLGSEKVEAHYVNAMDEDSVDHVMRDIDVVATPLPPSSEMLYNVMDAALDWGVHYVDFASTFPVLIRLFNLHDGWRETGITAITCMGEDPGMSDLFARYLTDRMDKPERIHVRDGAVARGKRVLATYAPGVFIGECMSKGLIYEDGEYKRVPPLSGREVYNFPKFGPQTVYFVPHEEPITIPRGIKKKVRYVDFKLTITDDTMMALKALDDLGLLSEEPIEIREGVYISPLEFLLKVIMPPAEAAGHVEGHECIVTEVIGEDRGKRVKRIMYSYMTHSEAFQKYGVTATAYMTGMPGAVAAYMLARGEIKFKGTVVPAQLDPEPIMQRLKENGIYIGELTVPLEE